MHRSSWRASGAVIVLLAAVSGCAQSSHVTDGTQSSLLASHNKAVAVMRLGSPNPNCQHAAVLLGVRDGAGYKRHTPVKIADIRGLEKAPVGEVELDAGEYHVVAFSCVAGNAPTVVADKTTDGHYRQSFAHFTLSPGEIVNVGSLYLDAANVKHSALGKAMRAEVTVTDWPLDDIERYKAARPELAAQMKTRLMVVGEGPKTAEQQAGSCARWRQAKADGLAQDVPKECAAP